MALNDAVKTNLLKDLYHWNYVSAVHVPICAFACYVDIHRLYIGSGYPF